MTDVVMFNGAYNVQLGGELLRIQYTNIAFMRGVDHTVSLFFNDVSNISDLKQIIKAHKAIYNLFGSGIYNKFYSISKSQSYESHNMNIGSFVGSDIRMAGYIYRFSSHMFYCKELFSQIYNKSK